MPDEKIEVEWIATATKMTQVLDRLENKLDKQEKALKKIGDQSKKATADAATGFNKIEKEVREAEMALKKLTAGTAEFARQKAKVDQLRASLQKAKTAMASSVPTGAMSAGIAKMAQLAAGMVGFQKIVQAVVFELEKAQNIKLRAAGTERTLEQSLIEMGPNIGGENIEAARELIRENAPKLDTTQQGLAMLIGNAVSAGAKDANEGLKVAAAALRIKGGDAEAANGILGGALDVASLGQSTNFEGAIGQLLQSASQLRGTDLSMFSEAVGSGMAAATAERQNQEGLSTEQALEYASVISQILKDQTGSVTATTLTQFVGRLDAFTPEAKVELKDGSISKLSREQINQFKQAKTVDARVELMRGSPDLARQFIDQQKEGKGKTAISEIAQGTARVLGFEQKARAAVTPIDKANVAYDVLADAVGRVGSATAADRRTKSNIEQFQTGGGLGLEGQGVQTLKDTIKELDLPGVDMLQERVIDFDMKASQDKIGTALEILSKLMSGEAGGFGKRELSAEEKDLVRLQIEVLKELRADRLRMGQGRPGQNPLPAVNVP